MIKRLKPSQQKLICGMVILNYLILIFLFCCFSLYPEGNDEIANDSLKTSLVIQHHQDSAAVADAIWTEKEIARGVLLKTTSLSIFNSIQAIYLVEVDTAVADVKFSVAVPETFAKTSEQARAHNAIVAMNGTYFYGNYSNNDSRHFVKTHNQVRYHTQDHEFDTRATGVVTITKNFVDISYWNREKETENAGEAEDALVAGPLVLNDNNRVNLWDNAFVHKRHPRSFMASKNGTIIFGVVDGRDTTRACGMTLTELRFFAEISDFSDLINFDGGGSSTLYVKNQGSDGIVNFPSRGKEIPVKSIIYLTLTKSK